MAVPFFCRFFVKKFGRIFFFRTFAHTDIISGYFLFIHFLKT